jgi:D-alanine-D-alanine ligase
MRIDVLAGGHTPEREVSLRSGHRVVAALAERGHDANLLDPAERSIGEALQERRPDLCYLALHGKEGEDGTVQRLLDLLGIAYTGTAALDCELAFDKVLAKDILARAGVRTPAWAVVEGWALRDLGAGAALGRVADLVGMPCVVKPSRSGSALGVSFVEREPDLPTAVMAALSFSGAAIVETKIEGSEVAAALVGDPPEALPLVEIVPKGGV